MFAFSPALLANTPTVPDSWASAIDAAIVAAKVLLALASLVFCVCCVRLLRKRHRLLDEIVREIVDDQPFVTLPDDGQTITICAKKSRVALYLASLIIAAAVCTAAGMWMWSDPRYQAGAVLVAFLDLLCGIYLLLGIMRLISRAPVLIVNAEGITDNATFIAAGMGLIPWHEILDIYIYEPQSRFRAKSNRSLTILADDDTIVRQQALWKRALYALNIGSSTAVRIPEFLLPMPLEELRAQIEEYTLAHGHMLPLSQVPAGTDTPASAD
ncbi:MAG: STM3941 family protein [Ktedonobacterales bacterium]